MKEFLILHKSAWRAFVPTVILLLLGAVVVLSSLDRVDAAPIVYLIKSSTQVFPPMMSGWRADVPSGTNVSVGSVFDPVQGGLPAWNVDDHSPHISPTYVYGPNNTDNNLIAQRGWWFHTRARYLTDYDGAGSNMGMQAYFAGRAYKVLLGLDEGGDLRATLPGLATPLLLTEGGTGTAGYHTFDLFARPGSPQVTFRFDGQDLALWDGVQSTAGHANVVKWGAEGANDQGSINFNEATLSSGNPMSSDYNYDGQVDLDDLALWLLHFGTTSHALPGNGDRDDDTDGADFLLWQQEFSPLPIRATNDPRFAVHGTFVPEPSCAAILIQLLVIHTFISPKRQPLTGLHSCVV